MINIFKKNKWILLSVCMIIFLVIIMYPKKEEKIVVDTFLFEEEIINANEILVDIKGAIQKPGVYALEKHSRVKDVIEKAGGLTKYADTSVLNLSKRLTDEMVIIIYTEAEILEMKKGTTSVKYIEKECICPKLENNACIEESITNKEETENRAKISLNSATIDELMTLPGIGKTKAEAIIKYREEVGFKTIEDLKNVKGIGNATFEKIKTYIML